MRFFIIAILLVAIIAVGSNAQAASLYSLSDMMTRQAPSVASDHTFSFKTPLALNSGQTITIGFATGFNLSSITSADVALSFGPSTGEENTSAITTLIASNSLTVTNNGGSISANDRINIQIGLVAGGTNRVYNPSTIGTKTISIVLGNGATGNLAVPIARDSVGVGQFAESINDGGAQDSTDPNLALPTIIFDFSAPDCPIFQSPYLTKGTRPSDVSVYINNSGEDFTYPTQTTWEKLLEYAMGINIFDIFGIYPTGQRTLLGNYQIERLGIGDVNGDARINDFDLAGLAWHWASNWCYADFNSDGRIDDFDLAGLSAHFGR